MNAYAYYDNNGKLLEYISDPAVREGNNGYNSIYVYLHDFSDNITSISVNYQLIGSSNTSTQIVNMSHQPYNNVKIPSFKDRDLKYFVSGKEYKMYKIDLPQDILSERGSVAMTISLYLGNYHPVKFNLGIITFYVEEEVATDKEITQSQFDYLLSQIGKEKLANKYEDVWLAKHFMKYRQDKGKPFQNNSGKTLYYAYGNTDSGREHLFTGYRKHSGLYWDKEDLKHFKKRYGEKIWPEYIDVDVPDKTIPGDYGKIEPASDVYLEDMLQKAADDIWNENLKVQEIQFNHNRFSILSGDAVDFDRFTTGNPYYNENVNVDDFAAYIEKRYDGADFPKFPIGLLRNQLSIVGTKSVAVKYKLNMEEADYNKFLEYGNEPYNGDWVFFFLTKYCTFGNTNFKKTARVYIVDREVQYKTKEDGSIIPVDEREVTGCRTKKVYACIQPVFYLLPPVVSYEYNEEEQTTKYYGEGVALVWFSDIYKHANYIDYDKYKARDLYERRWGWSHVVQDAVEGTYILDITNQIKFNEKIIKMVGYGIPADMITLQVILPKLYSDIIVSQSEYITGTSTGTFTLDDTSVVSTVTVNFDRDTTPSELGSHLRFDIDTRGDVAHIVCTYIE